MLFIVIIIVIIIIIIVIIIIIWIDIILKLYNLYVLSYLQSKIVQSFMAFREEQKKRYLDSFLSSFNRLPIVFSLKGCQYLGV